MILHYYGAQFLKVVHGDTTLAINPPKKEAKLDLPKFGANVAISSNSDDRYSGVSEMSFGETVPFEIENPGEFEVSSILIKGVSNEVETKKGKELNNVFAIEWEDMKIAVLGLSSRSLTDSAKDLVLGAHILVISLRDDITTPKEAAKVVTMIEPHIVIPVEYTKESLSAFLKEYGDDAKDTVEKLQVKRKEVESRDGDVIIIKS